MVCYASLARQKRPSQLCITYLYVSSIFLRVFVPELNHAIRALRRRLGQTMTQFSELLGLEQSTVSRYESGQVVPSRTVLILLLLLANDEEEPAILTALGVPTKEALALPRQKLREALPAIRNLHGRGDEEAELDQTLAAFAEEAHLILSKRVPVDRSLVELLKLYRRHHSNKRLRRAVVEMLSYFEFLTIGKAR